MCLVLAGRDLSEDMWVDFVPILGLDTAASPPLDQRMGFRLRPRRWLMAACGGLVETKAGMG